MGWLCWSNNLAAEVSGPNRARLLFMGFYNRHSLQDQIGILASNYERCCLLMKTPRNYAADSKLLFEPSKVMEYKQFRTLTDNSRRVLKCTNKFTQLTPSSISHAPTQNTCSSSIYGYRTNVALKFRTQHTSLITFHNTADWLWKSLYR
jgi:hypothetical protein